MVLDFSKKLEDSFGLKAIPISGEDVHGMTWYSINKNGRPTGDQNKIHTVYRQKKIVN